MARRFDGKLRLMGFMTGGLIARGLDGRGLDDRGELNGRDRYSGVRTG